MNTEHFEQWFKLNKNLTGPLAELQKTAAEICQRVAQENIELANKNVSRCTEQLKRLSSVKKPEEFFALQKECLTENMSAAMENVQKIMKSSVENMEKLADVWGSLCKSTTENVAAAAKPHHDNRREHDKERK